jgi:hypothetical protein
MLKKNARYIVMGILAIVFVVSLIVSNQESTTMDEQAHIPSGYSYMKYHDMRLNPEHPPLLKDLAGTPLQFMNLKFPTDSKEWQTGINEQWTIGNTFIHSNNADAVTFWSRFPIVLIALVLGIFIYLWTKEIAGTLAGLFAFILYAADPNVLGHNHYVTTDLGIAATIFISSYFFVHFLKKPIWRNILWAGLFLGIAQLSKFSAVLLFPLFTLIAIVYALALPALNRKEKWKTIGSYAGKYALVILICFASIWILYVFNTWNEPASKIQDVANTVFSNQGSGKIAKVVVISMSKIGSLKGMSEYLLGVFMVFVRVTGGNTYYFLGKVTNHASRAYFPVVFLIKETIPFLFLIVSALVIYLYQLGKSFPRVSGLKLFLSESWKKFRTYLHQGVAYYLAFGFILMYAYLSITGNLNIGFRHLFPILPFAYLLVAKKISEFFHLEHHDVTKKLATMIIAGLMIWIILEPIIFFPSYISYFNEAVGGPKNGYKYVTDSNTDWGQDLKRLRNWVNENNIDKIRVDYFGGSSPEYYLDGKFTPWHSNNVPEAGWYAISAGFLQESIYKDKSPGDRSYEWILKYPVTRIGDSIFVFYVDKV